MIRQELEEYFGEEKEEILYGIHKILKSIPFDCLSKEQYNYLHVAVARYKIIKDIDDSLLKYSLLYDISKVLSQFSHLKEGYSEIFDELCILFNLDTLSAAQQIKLQSLFKSCRDLSETELEALRITKQELGYFTYITNEAFSIFKRELIKK